MLSHFLNHCTTKLQLTSQHETTELWGAKYGILQRICPVLNDNEMLDPKFTDPGKSETLQQLPLQ